MHAQAIDRQARVIVAEDGVPVAALIPFADLERLDALDAQQPGWPANGELSGNADQDVPRDVAAAIAAVESARSLQAALLARRGEPFRPSSEILDEVRGERSQHLP